MKTRSKTTTQEPTRKIKQQPRNINLSESEHFKVKLSTIQRVLSDHIRKKVYISKSRAMNLLKEVTAIDGCIQYTKYHKIQQVTEKLIRQMKTIIEENDTNPIQYSQLQAEGISRNINSNMQSEELRSSQSTPSDIETLEELGKGLSLIYINDITKVDKKKRRSKLFSQSAKYNILKKKDKAKKDKTHISKVTEKITQPLTTIRERNYYDYSSYQRQQDSANVYANIHTNEAEELRSSQSTPSNIDAAENAKAMQSDWEPNGASSDNLPGLRQTHADLGSSADKDNAETIPLTRDVDTSSTTMYLDANIKLSRNDETVNSNSPSILSSFREMHNSKNWISEGQGIHLNKICGQDGQNTSKMSHCRSVIQKVAEHKEKLNFTSVVIAKAAADTGYTCTYNSERCNKNVNHAYDCTNKQRNNFEEPINKGEPFRKSIPLNNKVHNINYLKLAPLLTANLGNIYGKDIRNTSDREMEILTNLSKPIQKHTNADIKNLENFIPTHKIPNDNNFPRQISKKKFTESDTLKNTNISEKTQVQPFSDSLNTIPDSQYIDSGTNYALPKLFVTSNETSKSNSTLPKNNIGKTNKKTPRKPKTNSKASKLLENNSTNVSFGKNVSFRNKDNEVKELSWLENLQFVRCIEPEEYSTYCDEQFWREDVTFPGLCHEDFTN